MRIQNLNLRSIEKRNKKKPSGFNFGIALSASGILRKLSLAASNSWRIFWTSSQSRSASAPVMSFSNFKDFCSRDESVLWLLKPLLNPKEEIILKRNGNRSISPLYFTKTATRERLMQIERKKEGIPCGAAEPKLVECSWENVLMERRSVRNLWKEAMWGGWLASPQHMKSKSKDSNLLCVSLRGLHWWKKMFQLTDAGNVWESRKKLRETKTGSRANWCK